MTNTNGSKGLIVKAQDVFQIEIYDNETQFKKYFVPDIFTSEDLFPLKFPAEFLHQQFGESEIINGYEDLVIKLCYTSCSMIPFLSVYYSRLLENADPVVEIFSSLIPKIYRTASVNNFTEFLRKNESFSPIGELIFEGSTLLRQASCQKLFSDKNRITYQIRKSSLQLTDVKEFFKRIQTFSVFFIDGANFIEADDQNWTVYFLFINCPSTKLWKFIGFSTVYSFYAFPNHKRPRISQFLILPPYQKCGFGRKLLQGIYDDCLSNKEVVEVTVEDASLEFQNLRDLVDLINFDRQCKDISIPLKFTGEFMKAVQRKLKINKNQIRKIYDIIKLKETNRSDKECYKNYRLMVKRKIYYNYKSHLETLNKEEKLFLLDQLYKELESYYQSLLERFSRA